MVIAQSRAKRKPTGGRYVAARKKRLFEGGKGPTLTKIGATKAKQEVGKGGAIKTRLLNADVATLMDPKT